MKLNITYLQRQRQQPCLYENKFVKLNRKQLFVLAEIIHNQLFISYPSLKNIYQYFIDISKLLIKLNIPLTWVGAEPWRRRLGGSAALRHALLVVLN